MSNTGLSYEQLETAFRHRNYKPLYFLFGEERFLMEELQRVLLAHALAPHERGEAVAQRLMYKSR